jgi:hypothetical protein
MLVVLGTVAWAGWMGLSWGWGVLSSWATKPVYYVHVCNVADYDHGAVRCTLDATSVGPLELVRLQVDAPSRHGFTSNSLTVDISSPTPGLAGDLGSVTMTDVPFGHSRVAWPLDAIFSQAGVRPRPGTRYVISVSDPDLFIGSARTLTYQP